MKGEYRAQSKFNVSGREQALKLIEILQEWTKDGKEDDAGVKSK